MTDLSQSESSLAGANADFISAGNELLIAKSNFERIIREANIPKNEIFVSLND